MDSDFVNYLLQVANSESCKEIETIQSLWSGYGKISRYKLENSLYNTVVVKYISLDSSDTHPRGWNTGYAHSRKVKSYKVETNWYENWSSICIKNCRIPKFLGSFTKENNQWIILEDLNPYFPSRKTQITLEEIKICLKWLANFHVTFLNSIPSDLWKVGTYWHLETRPDEFKNIKHQELKSKANLIDKLLNECEFQTIVHGDAKLANFCFSEDGTSVAAVDFQYVGGGCGIKDVAYFLGSCLSSSECEVYQDQLLDYYFYELEKASNSIEINIDFIALEQEWRKMYPIACTDFTRFLMGWMPSHQKINNYNLTIMNTVLSNL